MTDQLVLSTSDMIEMIDQELYVAIGQTLDKFAEGKQITLTTVEMTLATFLGHEIGESCVNLEEIGVNCQAYNHLMLSAALGVHEYTKNKVMN